MIEVVGRLLCVAVVLQSLELLAIAPYPWEIAVAEIPRPLRSLVKIYNFWLVARVVAAVVGLLWPGALPFGVIVGTTWMINVRWRGTFNGGSDAMTFLIALSLCLGFLRPEWEPPALWYIAIQCALSYAISGFAKLRQPAWRDGTALARVLGRAPWSGDRALVWTMLGFECLFPLALCRPVLVVGFLGLGLGFHLVNAYLLGLNRFFFAWLAAYPAVYWASQHFQNPGPALP